MQILNIGLKIPQIKFKSNCVNYSKTNLKSDVFESSKPSLKQVVTELKQIKTSSGKERFSKDEISDFSEMYKKNKIDFETVKTFADTNLNMYNMSSIYKMYQKSLKDNIDMKKNTYGLIRSEVKNIYLRFNP